MPISKSGRSNISLDPFFDYMWGETTGYAYIATVDPTKGPEGEFKQHFFEWPAQREKLISKVENFADTYDVYFGPGLYSKPKADKDSFLGTRVVWVEFDGNAPKKLPENIPEPQVKIQSSRENYEHWYWKLPHTIRKLDLVENITARATYALQADHCFNANRILRVPGTVHQESKKTVQILHWTDLNTEIEEFAGLPDLPVRLVQVEDIKGVPKIVDVMLKYAFPPPASKLLKEESIEKGHRSAALFKLANFCVEMKMNSSETLSVMLFADNKWKKFAGRRNQREELIRVINNARAKHPIEPIEEELEEDNIRVFSHDEFMAHDIKFEWLIEGLLHKKGLISISGPPGIGKSQLALRMCEKLAKGEDFLQWKIPRPMRTLFISLEMPHEELREFLDTMAFPDKNGLLKQNLFYLPVGHGIKINNTSVRNDIDKTVEEFEPEGIMIDSFGKAILDDINSAKIVLEAMHYIDSVLRKQYGCWVGFIHHARKEQIGNKKPKDLDDLYGSMYYGASVTSAVGMWEVGQYIELNNLKMRMTKKFDSFLVQRTPDLDFEQIRGGRRKSAKSPNGPILGKMKNVNTDGPPGMSSL